MLTRRHAAVWSALLLCLGCICAGSPSSAEAEVDESTLKMVVIVHRHGDRTPVVIPEGQQDRWPAGPGQLTGTGVHQLWELGAHLRELIGTSFLDDSYYPGLVYSRASNKDRTLQSAEAMLMALFPPGTGPYYPFEDEEQSPALPEAFQPVPTHSVELARDYVLRGYQNCPRYLTYLEDTFYSSLGIAATEEHKDTLDALSAAFETEVTLQNLDLYYDYLWCSNMHGVQDMVNEELYEDTVSLYNWVYSQDFKPSNQSRLIGGALIGQVLDDMQAYVSGDDSTKAKLYSGHDVSLGTLRSVMGLQSDEVPPYASWAMFELHRISAEWQVKFTYNDEVEGLTFCAGDREGDYCPLSTYERVFRELVPEDPAAECALDGIDEDTTPAEDAPEEVGDSSSTVVSTAVLLAVLGAGDIVLVALVAILVGYIYILRKDRFLFVHGRQSGSGAADQPVEIELSEVSS